MRSSGTKSNWKKTTINYLFLKHTTTTAKVKINNEIKIGILAIIAIVCFVIGFNFLKGKGLWSNSMTLYATYNNVQGLNTASVVTINGVEVGKVIGINFNNNENKRGQLIVEFSIENDFEFSKNSVAKIYSASLMGGKSLAIVPSYEGETANPGDFLQGEIESDIFSSVTEKLNPLQAKVENVIVSADSLMTGLTDILDVKSRENIKLSISQLNTTIANFKSASESVNELIKNNDEKLAKTLENTELMTANLSKLSDTLVNSNLGLTIKNIEETVINLNNVLAGMESGEGSLGKLLKDDKNQKRR